MLSILTKNPEISDSLFCLVVVFHNNCGSLSLFFVLFCFVESKTPCKKMSNTELNYLRSLFNKSKNHRKKRATQNKRKRKEYRSLTEKERKVFHDAVLALKAKSVCYNLFIPFISEM